MNMLIYIMLFLAGFNSLLGLYVFMSNSLPKYILLNRDKTLRIISSFSIFLCVLGCVISFIIDSNALLIIILNDALFSGFIFISSWCKYLFSKNKDSKIIITTLDPEEYEVSNEVEIYPSIEIAHTYKGVIKIKSSGKIINVRQTLPTQNKKITLGYREEEGLNICEYIIIENKKSVIYYANILMNLYALILFAYGGIHIFIVGPSTDPNIYNKSIGFFLVPLAYFTTLWFYKSTKHVIGIVPKIEHIIATVMFYIFLIMIIVIWFI